MSRARIAGYFVVMMLCLAVSGNRVHSQQPPFQFHLVEATIADVHRAIQGGQLTCRALVQAYINRARAYNGTCNQLVTEQMAPSFLPDYDQYAAAVKATASLPPGDPRKTPPIEFGRMEPTSSDPSVQQQYGMTVGIANAGQVRALGMLNIRGERSVTCKGDFDRAPSAGPLPAGAPKVCEEFRKQPDALERAAELDAQYGRNPDLQNMPMYCIPFSFKDSYDVKDMRSTGGADAHYDMDFPRAITRWSPSCGRRARSSTPRRTPPSTTAAVLAIRGQEPPNEGARIHARLSAEHVGGNPCNAYDQTRAASIGSSSGSGVSVSTNLVMCSICEETGQSCRGPANHNSVALILPHKAHLSFLGGAIGAEIYNDRAGIHCRSLPDAVKVLDALKDPVNGYYDPRDIFTTVPRSSLPSEPYARAITEGSPGALRGMRIGIIREFMVKHAKVDEPIVDAAAAEMKAVLAGRLGATLVESLTPGWVDDPRRREHEDDDRSRDRGAGPCALPRPVVPAQCGRAAAVFRLCRQSAADGIRARRDQGHRLDDGCRLDGALGRRAGADTAQPHAARRVGGGQADAQSRTFRFHIAPVPDAAIEGAGPIAVFKEDTGRLAGAHARVSKFWGDDQRALRFKKLGRRITNLYEPPKGIAENIQRREFLRRVLMKVDARQQARFC
jgi:Asp-tRNA(Asn)/Glu-tRNA(Gln) amidotransferase A subunit family amidase